MPAESADRDWAARLAQVESRNVTFLSRETPFWTEALGARVRDAAGNVHLDFSGAFGVALAGHRHPGVEARLRSQSGRLVHGMGDIHPPAVKVEFMEALAKLLPWSESRIVLGLSGSDAVEAALKTAHLATGKPGIIAFEGSYHGLTLGALATTHREHFRTPFTDRLADQVCFVPFPVSAAGAADALGEVTRLLDGAAPVPVGAVIFEPIQGRAGVRIPPPGFLAELAARVAGNGALVIADEVFTGMGRTGTMFACDREGVTPDLVCLGKALGGGMPLSACCGAAHVMDAWPATTGEAIHTSTFLGNPMSCAGGLGFLEALAEDDIVGRARRLGGEALAYLSEALAGCDRVVSVRGRGLMLGIELREHDGPEVTGRALERGLIVLPAGERGEVVELTPPALLTAEELQAGLEILVAAIRATGRRRRGDRGADRR